ncbi:hypothetical protein [Actinokineospora iranica]|uniref:Peptidase family M41 n=1 Tax=Actinokineospora iranica TaxID=1271860 RepID=A0A1G6WSX8_9PSEU|nr:hypothetical protein [Actinokineospora iranica]SDD68317.1 hypothetical protein SAMN05216174_115133 [Actinokineospora iranica]
MSKKAPAGGMSEQDVQRFALAYHEAAHAVVHAMFGGHVVDVRISRGWFSGCYKGRARITGEVVPTEEAAHLLAGGIAMARWLEDNTDMSASAARRKGRESAQGDLSDLKALRRKYKDDAPTEKAAQRFAEELVNRHWSRISAVAERLAAKGRLSGADVRRLAGAPAVKKTRKGAA